jgi:hypothetical protein
LMASRSSLGTFGGSMTRGSAPGWASGRYWASILSRPSPCEPRSAGRQRRKYIDVVPIASPAGHERDPLWHLHLQRPQRRPLRSLCCLGLRRLDTGNRCIDLAARANHHRRWF